MDPIVAGIDIGGSKISIALSTLSGEMISSRRIATDSGSGPAATFEKLSEVLRRLIDEASRHPEAIGVGSPSPIDLERGVIMSPSNLLEWEDFPIVDLLRNRFGIPVQLENDANAAVLGEQNYGAGRGYQNVFYVTVSTGIGGGVIINGELYRGVATAAGEIGHTIIKPDGVRCNCGSIGCLETICGGVHIARRARERLATGEKSMLRDMVGGAQDLSARTVIEALRKGDPLAESIWNETCHFLSIGIANSISLFAPEVVIIGGGIASAGDLLFEQLRERVPSFVSMVPAGLINIVPAALGAESGVFGAVAIASKLVSTKLPSKYAA